MRHSDDLPYIVIEKHTVGVRPFLWGLLIGSGVGLLLAPRAGVATQADIRRRVDRARAAAEDQVETVRNRVEVLRDALEKRTDQAREVLDGGRRLARNARDEVDRLVRDSQGSDATISRPSGMPRERPTVQVVVTEVVQEDTDPRSDLG